MKIPGHPVRVASPGQRPGDYHRAAPTAYGDPVLITLRQRLAHVTRHQMILLRNKTTVDFSVPDLSSYLVGLVSVLNSENTGSGHIEGPIGILEFRQASRVLPITFAIRPPVQTLVF